MFARPVPKANLNSAQKKGIIFKALSEKKCGSVSQVLSLSLRLLTETAKKAAKKKAKKGDDGPV